MVWFSPVNDIMLEVGQGERPESDLDEFFDMPSANKVGKGLKENVLGGLAPAMDILFNNPSRALYEFLFAPPSPSKYFKKDAMGNKIEVDKYGEPLSKAQETPQPRDPQGNLRPPPQDQQVKMPVGNQTGFSRALPPKSKEEIRYDVRPEATDWVYDRMQELNALGVDTDSILNIVRKEYFDKIREGVDANDMYAGAAMRNQDYYRNYTPPTGPSEGQEQTELQPGRPSEGAPINPIDINDYEQGIIARSQAPRMQTPTWVPRTPTDWSEEVKKAAESAVPTWDKLPQMTGLPEYQKPTYGGIGGELLRALVLGAGKKAVGRDLQTEDEKKEAIAKAEVEKRRAEMRGDITAQRNYEMQRAQALANARLKEIDLKREAENKAVSDELAFYDMAIRADKTGTLINQLAPRIAQLRGIKPEDVKNLIDPETGQLKIAKSDIEIEREKTENAIQTRKSLLQKYPEIGAKMDASEKALFEMTGNLKYDTDIPTMLKKKALEAFQRQDAIGYQDAMRDLQNYAIATDEKFMIEQYRYNEAMKDITSLKGKLPDELLQQLLTYVKAYQYTGHGLPSLPKNSTAAQSTLQKLNPIYQKAVQALDPDAPAGAYQQFAAENGVTPEVFIEMFNEGNYKVQMPSNAVGLAIQRSQYSKTGKDGLLDELRTEAEDFNAGKIKKTPIRDQWVREAEPHIRGLYGRYIAKIEQERGKRLTPEEVAKFYEDVQQNGPPQFGIPKGKAATPPAKAPATQPEKRKPRGA